MTGVTVALRQKEKKPEDINEESVEEVVVGFFIFSENTIIGRVIPDIFSIVGLL